MRTPRWGRLIIVAVVTVLACLAAGPASAHSALIGTTPENGSTLSSVPETVDLEFNEEVGEISPAMVLRDSSENVIEQLTPQIDGRTMSGRLPEDMSSGEYSVAWRIVSVDGHPIQGVVEFALDLPGDAGAAGPSPDPSQTPVDEDPADAALVTTESDSSWLPWAVGGVALAAIVALVAVRLRGRQDES